jgi:hypothetical protein
MSSDVLARPSTSASPNVLRPHYAKLTQVSTTLFLFLPNATNRLTLSNFTVAKIDAVQAEYSAFETLHETSGLIATAKELGIAFVAFSPLGHGWLVDHFPFKSPDDFAPDDFRRTGT